MTKQEEILAIEEQQRLEAEAAAETSAETIAEVSFTSERQLLVTPSSIVVVPGGRTALRIRSNCAWRVVAFPDDAVLSTDSGFGDATFEVSAPEDAHIDGRFAFMTDDDSVTQTVDITSEAPAPPATEPPEDETSDDEQTTD